MTDADLPTSLTRLTFHGPLSEARAGRLVDRLTRTRPGTVLDVGCGLPHPGPRRLITGPRRPDRRRTG